MLGASLRYAVDRAVEIVAGTLFVIMCGLVLAQIVARKLGDPLVWSEELARYIFIWVSFLGLAIAARRGSHISIRLIYDRLGTRSRSALGIVIELATILLALIFLRYGWQLVVNNWDISTVTLFFDFAVVYSIIPIGALLMIFASIINISEHWRLIRSGDAA